MVTAATLAEQRYISIEPGRMFVQLTVGNRAFMSLDGRLSGNQQIKETTALTISTASAPFIPDLS
jgi:hypothetical protein